MCASSDLPLADKDLLVEDGPVGAQERGLDGLGVWDVGAHVEHLTARLQIGVVAYKCLHETELKDFYSRKTKGSLFLSIYRLVDRCK